MTVDYWEALFDREFLRWFDLDGKEVTVTIEKVSREELTLPGGQKRMKPVLTLKGAKKRLVLNKTNAGTIAELLGNKPSQWVGKSITLFESRTKKSGETVPCIRVKATTG